MVYNILLTSVILLLSLVQCNNTKRHHSETIEYYFTPRNVSYGIYDNGVFQFDLIQKSIKVPYDQRTYEISLNKDSVFELFYCKHSSEISINKMLSRSKEIPKDSIWKPRILIIENSVDTLYIDTNKNGLFSNHGYALDSTFIFSIIQQMPPDLKESWLKDTPARW